METAIKILIIDDDEDDRMLYKRLLERWPNHRCSYIEAGTGVEGMSIAKNRQDIDCILLDYYLPDGTGIEILEKMSIDQENIDTAPKRTFPIVMLTGQGNENVAIDALKKGAQDYLKKDSLKGDSLYRALENAIEKARLINQVEEQRVALAHLAYHDSLTGLPNRLMFSKELERSIARAVRYNRLMAVLYIDLDNFKYINDTLGHNCGDMLLKTVSKRLQECVRKSDIISRLGGDEFAIVLDEVSEFYDTSLVARRILAILQEPVLLEGGQEIFISASVGIATYPQGGKTAEELIRNADIAMYRAKQSGRNNYQNYCEELNRINRQEIEIEKSLHTAVDRSEFYLEYQPIYELKTNHLDSVEALIRWNHPTLKLVSPAKFIPMAEKTGLIVPIGMWVIRAVCEQIKVWEKESKREIRVAINLSPRQLHEKDFAKSVLTLIKSYEVKPEQIEFELTETALMKDSLLSRDVLLELQSSGIKIAIDDFGTGYSSLSYLKHLPVNRLKIDRSFTADVPDDPNDAAIVTSVISLARDLALDVIAEGIETETQLNFLIERDCRFGQGFSLGYPSSATDTALLWKR